MKNSLDAFFPAEEEKTEKTTYFARLGREISFQKLTSISIMV